MNYEEQSLISGLEEYIYDAEIANFRLAARISLFLDDKENFRSRNAREFLKNALDFSNQCDDKFRAIRRKLQILLSEERCL